ncbi:polyprenyl synthetase family protein [Paenibacillus radicis (ex Xue et al. 2023)]|uniref:Class 1 isoprenoid biosynthesis enzyme n=1 Tax=Paenibacillus radicis (ex Xue et al. 2023) TaxID=2972489 RepID=A0ABT1YUU3_9BACL|nr:class 1 isoprenoid biosynthesis enzyme [Paenibacillus radicis (ex Xue et al. 2023)]MCR8636420.1 class 1 isoprenoid biosynthesis enzyme [Paenibacillus radicis (ex Xue et al. 2023)]
MDRYVVEEIYRVIDEYIYSNDLNILIKQFVQEKASENSIWSRITEYSHRMLGGTFSHIGQVAALSEIIILALDIVDDLQDQDNTAKPWMTCAPQFTLNALLAFQTIFMGEMGRLQQSYGGSSNLVEEASRILAGAINGQQKDLNGSVTMEADCLVMVREKSGSLIKLACYMGYAFVENCSQETIAQMNELADCIGIMAQIENDMKDVMRFDLKNDLLQKKRTLPIIFLLQHGDQDFPILKQFYEGDLSAEQFLKHKLACLQYIADSGCIEYCKIVQSLYFNRANDLYASMPSCSPWREEFKEITFASYEIKEESTR